mmetsp:Transcript_21803/g.60613  ORF Transcript_21803/g.60613 Transcript_21803/m.60613 type:complete len:355 (+) Transcript_21803:13-1077(+)
MGPADREGALEEASCLAQQPQHKQKAVSPAWVGATSDVPIMGKQPSPSPESAASSQRGLLRHVWPMPPAVLVVLFPLMHRCLLVNAGYTKWFHAISFCYLLTQNVWLSKFLAVMGTTVTFGWWASMSYDLYTHGRFAHILFWNMPEIMTQHMLNDENQVVYDTPQSVSMIALSHLLDTLGHPVLALYYWSLHRFQLSKVLSWSVLIGTYALSRYWSCFHQYYNDGVVHPFYIGRDVYQIHDDNDDHLFGLWAPAYLAEGTCYVLFTLFKVFLDFPAALDEKTVASKDQQHQGTRILLERASTSISTSSLLDDSSDEMDYTDKPILSSDDMDESDNVSVLHCISGLAFLDVKSTS